MPNLSKKSGTGRAKYKVEPRAVTEQAEYVENRTDTVSRWNLHRADHQIWRMEKYTLEELKLGGAMANPALWPSFTFNGPRTYWNAIRRAVTANNPRIKVKLPGFNEAENNVALYNQMLIETDRHEHFAYGLWAEVDERRVRRGLRPFQSSYAFLMAVRGGAFLRPWFISDERFPFDVDLWDPLTVSYEMGSDGLSWACHHYKAPYYDLADRYPDKFADYKDSRGFARDRLGADEENNVEVRDCWWCEYDTNGKPHVWSAVIAGDDVPLQDPYEWRDIDHIPVILTRSFGPDIETEHDYRSISRATEDAWESIYTANKNIYPWINRILTLYGLYLRNNAIGPWHARGTDLSSEQLMNALKPFNVIQSRRPDATITPLSMPSMAQEVKEFRAILEGMEQRGSVPYSLYGQLSMELSGYAVNQLQGAIGITAEPLSQAMGMGYRLSTDELIQQFRQRGKRVSVKGMDTRNRAFIEDIKKSDLRDKYHLEVEVRPELPADQLQTAQVAQTWAQVGVDPLTILDEILKVSSPRDVLRRMVLWQELTALQQAEIAGASQPAIPGGPPPEAQPPEARGIQSGFSPSYQQTSQATLDSAGLG